jgi:CDP-Glycerol:Poly(glycerophosphate) glycerophosphotransferase
MAATPPELSDVQASPTPREIRAAYKNSITRIGYGDLALAGIHWLGFVCLALGVLARSPWVALGGAVVIVGSQVAITASRSLTTRALSYIGISRATRVLLLVLLVILLQVTLAFTPDSRADGFSFWRTPVDTAAGIVPLVALAAALSYLAVLAYQWRDRGFALSSLAWRGLGRVGLPDSRLPVPPLGTNQLALLPAAVLSIGDLAALTGNAASEWLIVVATVSSAAAIVSCITSLVRRRQMQREGYRPTRIARLQEALDAFAPEVVIFFTAPANGTYALNVWLKTASSFATRTLIVLSEASHLANIEDTDLPLVVATQARDIEYLTVDSVRVVLHPTTGNKVFQIMRLRGLSQIFIGHGDSDKVSSFNPYTRIFDEIWVSGPAGIDRYRALDEGFRTDQFVTVGRPQLAEIASLSDEELVAGVSSRPTVLYAPTWEGFLEQSNYSSLATMGVPMVKAMLAMPTPPRILFKPHPSSGHRRSDMIAAQEEISRLLREAGSDHEVYGDGTVSLYAAFNQADTMITDISSVLTDFLASHKPYVVTNPRSEPLEDFLQAFPSAAAGTIVDADLATQRGSDFTTAIELALTGDIAGSPARVALSEYLLGPIREDPVASFAQEVALAVDRARLRYPGARSVPRAPKLQSGPAVETSDAAPLDSAGALS